MDKPWLKHYEPHVPEHIDYPNKTLPQALKESAEKYPGRTAMIFKGARMSFAELDETVDRLAAALDVVVIDHHTASQDLPRAVRLVEVLDGEDHAATAGAGRLRALHLDGPTVNRRSVELADRLLGILDHVVLPRLADEHPRVREHALRKLLELMGIAMERGYPDLSRLDCERMASAADGVVRGQPEQRPCAVLDFFSAFLADSAKNK